MTFATQSTEQDGVTIVAASGDLDSRSSAEFEAVLQKILAQKVKLLLLDLSQLEFITSAGLRVLLKIGQRLAGEGGRLAMCSLRAEVEHVLKIAGLVSVFHIEQDPARAAAWLRDAVRAARISSLAAGLLGRGDAKLRRIAAGAADPERSSLAAKLLDSDSGPAKPT
jgi:anti-anti-sigma factor